MRVVLKTHLELNHNKRFQRILIIVLIITSKMALIKKIPITISITLLML